MFRISRMTDYGVVLLSYMARRPDALSTAPELAERTTLPAPTVAKILKALAKAKVITAQRGAQGGYALQRPATQVTVSEIVAALDGPVALTACVDGSTDDCKVENLCPMAGGWNRINTAVQTALDSVTLADLIADSAMIPSFEARPAHETASAGR
ncbi:MAG: SUF system Fe-S cluster assembly regulator [Alphaproteobacteria bacterium]|uniref:SUF system Fe-S cluster assembly regulator n=1 Tax=Pacificispira sp. TaxID=2888761 RepID=UPI001B16A530|nr:SUF system Fe-S cluster assembly regulator [Alphaproteobacteria bacterium]MBO6864850.1 SUF system Fe-S cluster assembly regulator [Alphaproteobacteria bacterium]MEC9268296.1 SUF system Fe-S cluster assembly regulator [Pseudomonadota bacterium]